MAPGPIHSAFEKAVLDVNVGPGFSNMAGNLSSVCTLAADRLANSHLTASVRLLLMIKLFGKPLVDVVARRWSALGVHRLRAESKEQNNIRQNTNKGWKHGHYLTRADDGGSSLQGPHAACATRKLAE